MTGAAVVGAGAEFAMRGLAAADGALTGCAVRGLAPGGAAEVGATPAFEVAETAGLAAREAAADCAADELAVYELAALDGAPVRLLA
jgi:hypothetical protein